jgi:hypothetical protein
MVAQFTRVRRHVAPPALSPAEFLYPCANVGVDRSSVGRLFIVSPNPVFDQVSITYWVIPAERVSLSIYDVGGRRVRSFPTISGDGARSLRWDLRADDGSPVRAGTAASCGWNVEVGR